jgi:hypothetical protein
LGQQAANEWAFLKRSCDEAYAIIDAVDTAKKKRSLDVKKINAFLASVK